MNLITILISCLTISHLSVSAMDALDKTDDYENNSADESKNTPKDNPGTKQIIKSYNLRQDNAFKDAFKKEEKNKDEIKLQQKIVAGLLARKIVEPEEVLVKPINRTFKLITMDENEVVDALDLSFKKLFDSVGLTHIKYCVANSTQNKIGKKVELITLWFAKEILLANNLDESKNIIKKILRISNELYNRHNYFAAANVFFSLTYFNTARLFEDDPEIMESKNWKTVESISSLNNHKTYYDLCSKYNNHVPRFDIVLGNLVKAETKYKLVQGNIDICCEKMRELSRTLEFEETKRQVNDSIIAAEKAMNCLAKCAIPLTIHYAEVDSDNFDPSMLILFFLNLNKENADLPDHTKDMRSKQLMKGKSKLKKHISTDDLSKWTALNLSGFLRTRQQLLANDLPHFTAEISDKLNGKRIKFQKNILVEYFNEETINALISEEKTRYRKQKKLLFDRRIFNGQDLIDYLGDKTEEERFEKLEKLQINKYTASLLLEFHPTNYDIEKIKLLDLSNFNNIVSTTSSSERITPESPEKKTRY